MLMKEEEKTLTRQTHVLIIIVSTVTKLYFLWFHFHWCSPDDAAQVVYTLREINTTNSTCRITEIHIIVVLSVVIKRLSWDHRLHICKPAVWAVDVKAGRGFIKRTCGPSADWNSVNPLVPSMQRRLDRPKQRFCWLADCATSSVESTAASRGGVWVGSTQHSTVGPLRTLTSVMVGVKSVEGRDR